MKIVLVIVTDHKEFRDYDREKTGNNMRSKVIVDARQMPELTELRRLGFVYGGIGYL
jgi:UDP-N-acetyl-D-mannosaminuronic acid dehydrogenase